MCSSQLIIWRLVLLGPGEVRLMVDQIVTLKIHG